MRMHQSIINRVTEMVIKERELNPSIVSDSYAFEQAYHKWKAIIEKKLPLRPEGSMGLHDDFELEG